MLETLIFFLSFLFWASNFTFHEVLHNHLHANYALHINDVAGVGHKMKIFKISPSQSNPKPNFERDI